MIRELQIGLGRAFLEADQEGVASQSALEGLRPLRRISAAESLGIYQDAIRSALLASLRDIFPVCAALVGEDCFREIARRYDLVRAPHVDLGRSGTGLPEFVRGQAFLASVPYLADVAELELAWHDAFSAPSVPPAGSQEPSRIGEAISQAPDRWRFVLPPSARLVSSPYPILAIWEAHERGSEEVSELPEIAAAREGDRLIVWRRQLDLRVERVDLHLWPLLEAIESGSSVASLLTLGEAAAVDGPEELASSPAEDFGPALASIGELFERGWVAGGEPLPDFSTTETGKEHR